MNKDRFKDRLSEELLSIDGNTDDLQPLKDNVSILSKVLLDAVVYMIETENIKSATKHLEKASEIAFIVITSASRPERLVCEAVQTGQENS